jgi:uncharacterized C2H2 Zn-finger protein
MKKLQEENKKVDNDGALMALRSAMDVLRNRLQKAEGARERLEREMGDMVKHKVAQETRQFEQQQELRDYKERLKMCEQEYTEQYVERRKLSKELRRLQKNQATGELGRASSERETSASSMQLGREELVQQMNALSQELTKRDEMVTKYQALYTEERKKCEDLQMQLQVRRVEQQGATGESVEAEKKRPSLLREKTTPPRSSADLDDVTKEFDPLSSSSRTPTSQDPPTLVREVSHVEKGLNLSCNSPMNSQGQTGSGVCHKPLPVVTEMSADSNDSNVARSAHSILSSFKGWESLGPAPPPDNFCPFCQSVFPNAESLFEHVDAHQRADQEGKRVCPMCDKMFDINDEESLAKHVNQHLDGRN